MSVTEEHCQSKYEEGTARSRKDKTITYPCNKFNAISKCEQHLKFRIFLETKKDQRGREGKRERGREEGRKEERRSERGNTGLGEGRKEARNFLSQLGPNFHEFSLPCFVLSLVQNLTMRVIN